MVSGRSGWAAGALLLGCGAATGGAEATATASASAASTGEGETAAISATSVASGSGSTSDAASAGASDGATSTGEAPAGPPWIEVTLLASQTDVALGAAQGAEVRDGRVYVFGDRGGVGVIREYEFDAGAPSLDFTGREVLLQRAGVDLAPHPTGLTWHPEFGTLLGNTVGGVGTIFVIDWARLWSDGDLDDAVLAEIADDPAAGGVRPEMIAVDGVWRVATAGYLGSGNVLRLFDPAALVAAPSTSAPGVEVAALPFGPWVQALAYAEEEGVVVAAQNLAYGSGWKIAAAPLGAGGLGEVQEIVAGLPGGELEGFHPIGDGAHAVLVTSAAADNLWIAAFGAAR